LNIEHVIKLTARLYIIVYYRIVSYRIVSNRIESNRIESNRIESNYRDLTPSTSASSAVLTGQSALLLSGDGADGADGKVLLRTTTMEGRNDIDKTVGIILG